MFYKRKRAFFSGRSEGDKKEIDDSRHLPAFSLGSRSSLIQLVARPLFRSSPPWFPLTESLEQASRSVNPNFPPAVIRIRR